MCFTSLGYPLYGTMRLRLFSSHSTCITATEPNPTMQRGAWLWSGPSPSASQGRAIAIASRPTFVNSETRDILMGSRTRVRPLTIFMGYLWPFQVIWDNKKKSIFLRPGQVSLVSFSVTTYGLRALQFESEIEVRD